MTGRVIKFDGHKGYGFVEPANGSEDVFLHVNDLLFPESQLRLGVLLTFDVERGERGRRAVHVELANEPARTPLRTVAAEVVLPAQRTEEPLSEAVAVPQPVAQAAPEVAPVPTELPVEASVQPSPPLRSVLFDDDNNDALCDVLTVEEFTAEVTEVLLVAAPEITASQILRLRGALIELARDHSWIDESAPHPGIAAV